MPRSARPPARLLLASLLLAASASPTLACARVTTVGSADPITVQARPPALELEDLPPVPQPPPPRRVIAEGDVLLLDEPLGFDGEDQLATADHADILTEVRAWLDEHPEVLELTVEIATAPEGSKRTQQKRRKALTTQVVDALVGQGVSAERLLASPGVASEDGLVHVILRVSARAGEDDGASVGFEIEE